MSDNPTLAAALQRRDGDWSIKKSAVLKVQRARRRVP